MGDCRRCSGNKGGTSRKSCRNESEIQRYLKELEDTLLKLKRRKESLEKVSRRGTSCCSPPKPKKRSCSCKHKLNSPAEPACNSPIEEYGFQHSPTKPEYGFQKPASQTPSYSGQEQTYGCENEDLLSVAETAIMEKMSVYERKPRSSRYWQRQKGRSDVCEKEGESKDEWEASVLRSLKLLMEHPLSNQRRQFKSKSSFAQWDKCNDKQDESVKQKVSNRPDVCFEGQLQSVSVSSCEDEEDEPVNICQLCREESEYECGQREACSLDDICRANLEEDECDDEGKEGSRDDVSEVGNEDDADGNEGNEKGEPVDDAEKDGPG